MKVTDEIKVAILREIEEVERRYQHYITDGIGEKSEKSEKLEKLQRAKEYLANNLVSPKLLHDLQLDLYDVPSVELSSREIERINEKLKSIGFTRTCEDFQNDNGTYDFHDVINAYSECAFSREDLSEEEYIPLKPEIIRIISENIHKCTKTREIEQRVLEGLKVGKISYEDLKTIIETFMFRITDLTDIERLDEKSKELYGIPLERYDAGLITTEEMLQMIGSEEENEFLLTFDKGVRRKQYKKLQEGIYDIFEYRKKLNELEESLPDDLLGQMDELLSEIEPEKIHELDFTKAEEIINCYNAIANNAWIRYLDGSTNFLMHAVSKPRKEKSDIIKRAMSTTLISLESGKQIKGTYRDMQVGYIIKPKHIMAADSKDIMAINHVPDIFSQWTVSPALKLPQIVKSEMLAKTEEDAYSEILVDDYEIEGVVSKSRRR